MSTAGPVVCSSWQLKYLLKLSLALSLLLSLVVFLSWQITSYNYHRDHLYHDRSHFIFFIFSTTAGGQLLAWTSMIIFDYILS